MPTFKNLNDLLKYANRQSQSALRNEVAEVAKRQMSSVIEEVTYESYTPTEYVRTHELSSVEVMEIEFVDDHTISIINTRKDGNVDVARVVSSGIGYSWQNSAIAKAQLARNFYEDTYNFLLNNGLHIKAYRDGMRKRGLNIK